MSSQPIFNILIASLCSTILASVFILLRTVLFKYIGARWNYYLWFIIFIPWFSVWLPVDFIPEINTTFNFNTLTNHLNTQIQHQLPHFNFSISNIFFIFWLIGVLISSIYLLAKHMQFILLLKKHSQSLTVSQQEIVKEAIVNKDLISSTRIYISKLISSPLICHIVKSKIYLPENFFLDYTFIEKKYIVQHECVHYQRCDLIANTAMLVLICLNWFNPVIFFSYRYFRCAQELSCDSILSQQFSSAEKKAYGYALLKSANQPPSQISTMSCWWNSGKQLKERCHMLKYHHAKPVKNLLGIFIFAAATSFAIAAPSLEKRNIDNDLKVANSSKNVLSFSINNICSAEINVIKARSVQIVPRKNLNTACQSSPTHCDAFVYPTANCSGNPIAEITFDITGWGVMKIVTLGSYNVGASGFNLFFVGPWTDDRVIN